MHLVDGHQSGGFMMRDAWKYGNFHECLDSYAYVLAEGESEPPPHIRRAWDDALAVRKIIEDNVTIGRTAGENFEILKQKIDEAGFIYVSTVRTSTGHRTPTRHGFRSISTRPGRASMHPGSAVWARTGSGTSSSRCTTTSTSSTGSTSPCRSGAKGKSLNMRFHDGAMVTDKGVEYFFPPPTELALIR